MTTGTNDYAERAASAFNRRDLEAMLALVSEDVIYFDGVGIQTGLEAMHKRRRALLAAFPDAKMNLSPFVATDDRLALTVFLSGTFTAPLVVSGRVIPPHGRHITLYYAAHLTFRNGLVIREEVFFDSVVLMPLADQSEE
ncbi:ester cyclase [Aeromonas rivuli]|uniref:ester cyclase n=1 Tax=Aeromonas rivuli TaxID=648794 RepID=UPI0005A9BFF6|nr:nuclear transport factor 2 family protein [Aeromonas rivuli]